MKTSALLVCVLLFGQSLLIDLHAQATPRHLARKAIEANASENQALRKSLNEAPAPAPAPPSTPAPAARPPTIVATNVVPEKTPEQKARILQKTIEFQKKRAESGAPSAQYDLGMRYLTGDGLEKNVELGRKWIQEAAKNGNVQAAKKLQELDK